MKFIASITLVLLMACSFMVHAQSRLDEADTQFLERAAQMSMLEIQASQLALQNTSDERVRQYAQLILIEHEKIAGDLQGLASTHQLTLPTELGPEPIGTLTKLQQEKGSTFDQRYVKEVAIGAHQDAVEHFARQAKDSRNQDVSAFAAKSLPMLQRHLDRGNNILIRNKAPR